MEITTIALDAGHNAPNGDTGAIGILKEDNCIDAVMEYLPNLLEKLGYKVILVAPENSVSVRESLNARCYAANMANADLFVSLHFNAFNSKANGTEIFLSNLDNKRPIYKVAERILNNLVNLGFRNRGLKTSNLYVLKNTIMPAMLIEVCFIDNQSDCQKFDARKAAVAIAEGISGSPITVQMLTPEKQEIEKARLEITENTLLKPSTQQSKDIPVIQMKNINKGFTCDVELLCNEEQHYEVKFLNGVHEGIKGFVFQGHCNLTPYWD